MPQLFRRTFPYLAIGLLLAALAWATSFGTLPRADFTFDNYTEIETVDPALATGQPEHRIICAFFEGLLRPMPPENWKELDGFGKNVPLHPSPGMAEMPEISDDGRVYTFRMRPEAKWTDGTPVTAHDFEWTWMRMLHPETASRYANLLYDYIDGGAAYNRAEVGANDRVEVELADRRDPLQLFPRGTMLHGVLVSVHKPPEPQLPAAATDKQRSDAEVSWKKSWIYVVEVKPAKDGTVDWDAAGEQRLFAKDRAAMKPDTITLARPVERCHHVLPDFDSTVGVKAENDQTLAITLRHRTPFFNDLAAYYPLYPVNRRCIETHGSPNWTKAENIVSNGPFKLQFRRIRDRIRMVKNEQYWEAANVHLNSIDALATKGETTALNMYLNGQIDWATYMPISTIPILKKDYPGELRSGPELTIYFYRVNVTRPELRDPRVRRALGMAIDKQRICDLVTRSGEMAAGAVVPPGLAGYTSPPGDTFDIQQARRLLADAGYSGGRGLPPIEILYNDMDIHRTVAETVQQMWKENVGVDAELRGLEWGVYLDSTHKLDYDVARAGWIADYPDPNTFLDMFMSDNENNQTGWANAKYDDLLRQAASEADPQRRMSLLSQAEAILLAELPVIPIYFRVSKNLVRSRVEGFFNTVQDDHPLRLLRIRD